jgi:hypothetical protein
MIRASVAEVQKDLAGFLRLARTEPVEIEEGGVVVARLVSGYDPDDEALMAWLSLAPRGEGPLRRLARAGCARRYGHPRGRLA